MASLTTGRLAMALSLAVLAMTACGPRNGGSTVAAQCPAQNERYCAAAVGDLLDLPLGELRPTQPSLGYDEVYYRLGRYTLGPDAAHQLLDAWCATNGQKGLRSAKPGSRVADPTSFTCEVPIGSETPATTAPMKTGVIGPGGRVYLTDGHHTLTSFWEAPGGGPGTHIRLKVTGNLFMLEPDDFWREMKDRGWTWLQDANGKPVDPQQLPTSLGLTRQQPGLPGVLLGPVAARPDRPRPAAGELHSYRTTVLSDFGRQRGHSDGRSPRRRRDRELPHRRRARQAEAVRTESV